MRRGTSLIEAVVFLAVGLMVLALTAFFHARLTRHDTWNAARLSATESLLIAWEHIQLDLACAGPGHVLPTEDGRGLAVERAKAPRDARTEPIDYASGPARSCQRAGRALNAVRLDAMQFTWRDEATSLLSVRLVSGGDRVESGGVTHEPTILSADVQIAGRARHAEFPSFVDND